MKATRKDRLVVLPLLIIAATAGRGAAALDTTGGGCGSLFSWAAKHGARLHRAQVGVDPATGLRGIAARSALAPREALLKVPRGILVVSSRERVLASGSSLGVSPAEFDSSTVEVRLALTLLAVKREREARRKRQPIRSPPHPSAPTLNEQTATDTDWGPYLDTLPELGDLDASVAISWSDEQLEGLLGCSPLFVAKARRMRSRREATVRSLCSPSGPINARLQHAGTDESTLQPGMTQEELSWALNVVGSRALEGKFGSGGMVRGLMAAYAVTVTITATFFAAMNAPFGFQRPLGDGAVAATSAVIASSLPIGEGLSLTPLLLALPSALCALALVFVGMREEIALIPVVDLGNHASASRRSYLAYDIFSDCLSLAFDGELRQGEEARYCYGGRARGIGNDRLLLLYGFVESDNLHDRHEVSLSGCWGESAVLGRGGKVVQIPKWRSDRSRRGRGTGKQMDGSNDETLVMTTAVGRDPVVLSQLRAIVSAVQNELDRLVQSNERERHILSTYKGSDDKETCRRKLAILWQTEKIRLLREFENTHADKCK